MFNRAAQAYNWFYKKTLVLSGKLEDKSSSSTGVKYMAPSRINFMHCDEEKVEGSEFNVPELSERILANGAQPTVQVVRKDGHYFTLNNLQLEVCRQLETDGRCDHVQVKVVSIKNVPHQVRRLMKVPDNSETAADDPSRATGTGYQQVNRVTSDRLRETDDSASDDVSDDFTDDDDDDDDGDDDEDDDSEFCSSSEGEETSVDDSSINGVNSHSGSSDNEQDSLL